MNNAHLDADTLLPGFRHATIAQIKHTAKTTILVAVDTTQMCFNASKGVPTRHGLTRHSSGSQGYFSHVSLALTSHAPFLPLGILDIHHFVIESSLDHEFARSFWNEKDGIWESKQQRWVSQVLELERALEDTNTEAIYVMDREGDSFADLAAYQENECRFIIRACQLSRTLTEKVGDAFQPGDLEAECEALGDCTMEVSERTQEHIANSLHPKRAAREAKFELRSCRARFEAPARLKEYRGREVETWVVFATEVDTPKGETPMKWVLLTSEDASSYEKAFEILQQYAGRWKFEELFKCLKTGTNFEERQLESVEGLLKEEVLSFVVALTLLALRDWGRETPEAPASQVLSELELEVLQALVPGVTWSKRPTCFEALMGLAKLGGWVKRKDRPPGWIILGRAYVRLQEAVRIWAIARQHHST